MKERPILFKGEMVNAILNGRKTQTRRVMKVQPPHRANLVRISDDMAFFCDGDHPKNHECEEHEYSIKCPYGKPGDRLWVRETFQGPLVNHELAEEYYADNEKFHSPDYCQYRADGGPSPVYVDADDEERYGWKPSIFMPRWASRILLEITDVRVERLQDISYSDAESEGMYGKYGNLQSGWLGTKRGYSTIDQFSDLWKSINGNDSWNANPWVWVIEFKRVEQ